MECGSGDGGGGMVGGCQEDQKQKHCIRMFVQKLDQFITFIGY
jgi:hypothetical protein